MSDTELATEIKKTTLGKKIGTWAFVVSEILVIVGIIIIGINIFFEKKVDGTIITNLLLFQGSIMAITWGAKLTSNFVKKEQVNG